MYEDALRYLKLGFGLVKLPPRSKGDTRNPKGWNTIEDVINTPEKAEVWLNEPDCNMGIVHEFSNTMQLI